MYVISPQLLVLELLRWQGAPYSPQNTLSLVIYAWDVCSYSMQPLHLDSIPTVKLNAAGFVGSGDPHDGDCQGVQMRADACT